MSKSVKFNICSVMAILLIALFASSSFAALGKISGTVTDASTGEPLPGVNVVLAGTNLGAATDTQGQYYIINVPPGRYDVKFTYMGYATHTVENVQARMDVTTPLDVELKQTVIEGETVTVVAEPPVVDKTMTATKVSFSEDMIENTLPTNSLDEILQTSVTTQAMRGANKSGVGYMVDGVEITDPYGATGLGAQGYSMIKRDDTPLSNVTGQFQNMTSTSDRKAGMVSTSMEVAQSSVQEVNVIAGTINAEYAASGGVINVASRSGGKALSAKLYVRSSLGGLDHVGPAIYDEEPPAGEFADMTAAEHYLAYKDFLKSADTEATRALADLMDWAPGKYPYGDDPRMNGEFYLGGPLTEKGNFFLSSMMLNDNGRFPGEFQRKWTNSLKINYDVTDSDRLTFMGKIEDGGKLLGWYNRQYTYMHTFFLEGQPVNQKLGTLFYVKHNHVFDASSFLETTISYLGNDREYGFAPVDDKLQFDNYADDFLILDSYDKSQKYLVDSGTRIFDQAAGNNNTYQVDDFGNQIRFGLSGYSYENYKTSDLTIKSNYTKQLNFNHQVKTGFEYSMNTFDVVQHNVSAGSYDADFPFVINDYEVNPWSVGAYIQDRVEYEGIIVNIGIRLDGYNTDSKALEDLFQPSMIDSTGYGQKYVAAKLADENETRWYFSPRLGISHPISENAAMHYSWGIYTTKPTPAQWYQDYGTFANISWPHYYESDTDPEIATAYEIGLNMALARDFGMDITAYYRDSRNAGQAAYTIQPVRGSTPFNFYSYHLSWGYRDSRGIELTLWKRPSQNRYFDFVGVSGNLSLSFAYDAGSSNASNLVTDQSAKSTLSGGSQDEAYDFDLRYYWPTYTRTYSDWNGKLTLLFDFPAEIKLTTITTYRSPWRYRKTINATNERYNEMLDGDDFLRTDLRLIKYLTLGNFRAGVFFEALNVFGAENILSFDTHNNSRYYEEGKGPWGPLNRPVDPWGNPYAGIARELYAGFEISF